MAWGRVMWAPFQASWLRSVFRFVILPSAVVWELRTWERHAHLRVAEPFTAVKSARLFQRAAFIHTMWLLLLFLLIVGQVMALTVVLAAGMASEFAGSKLEQLHEKLRDPDFMMSLM